MTSLERAERACENAWIAYRKARKRVAAERQKNGRASFHAQQAFIETGERVSRTAKALADARFRADMKRVLA